MAGGGLLSDKVNAARVALARFVLRISMHTLELCVCYTRIKAVPYGGPFNPSPVVTIQLDREIRRVLDTDSR